MADEVPIYRSQAPAPNIGSLSIAPIRVPDLHSGEGLSEGMIQLGQALSKYAAYKAAADAETRTNTAMTGFVTGLDQAENDAAQSQDWENAPKDFRAKAAELAKQALDNANLDPAARSQMELRLRTLTLASGGRVDSAALGKQVDVANAARGASALAMSRAAVDAGSDAERQAMIDQQLNMIETNVRAGLLPADKGEAEKEAFLKSVDDGSIRKLIRTAPADAVAALNDPKRFPGISGSEREVYRASAETAKDEAVKDGLLTDASGSTPWKASLRMNKGLSREDEDNIYHKGIIQIGGPAVGRRGQWWNEQRVSYAVDYLMKNAGLSEIGARGLVARWAFVEAGAGPGAVNPSSGAVGIAQWLGARKAGVKAGDFEGQLAHAARELTGSEKQAGDVLRGATTAAEAARGASMFERAEGYNAATGTDLFTRRTAVAIGAVGGVAGGAADLARWHTSLDAMDHNIALSAAAYMGGVDKANEWRDLAFAKYGEDATPLEIATIITDKTTHDFVMQLFGYMAVPPTGPGLSPHARVQTETALSSVYDKRQNEQVRVIKELAAMDRATGGDETLDQLKKGYAAWTPAFDQVVQHNVAAAAAGSAEAAAFVEKVKTAQEAKPSIEDAWRMGAPQRESELSRLEAAAASGAASHADLVRLGAFRAVKEAIGASDRTDPVGLGDRAGLYQAQPLDPNAAPDDPRFLESLAVRGTQAVRAETIYNTLAPFRPSEADALKQRFAEASTEDKLALLLGMREAFGSDRVYKAAIGQLGLDPATATAGRFAPESPELAKKILIGAAMQNVPGVEQGTSVIGAAIAAAIGGDTLYPPGSPQLADAITAAMAVYVANRGPSALGAPPDEDAMRDAIEETLGPMVEIGRHNVAAWPGVSATRFEELWDNLSDAQLAAGRPVNARVPGLDQVVDQAGRPITADELKGHAILTQKAPRGSQYYVSDGAGNRYFREDHTPLLLDFRYLDEHAARADAEASAAAARAASERATGAAGETPAAEVRRRGPGALFGDQPLGRFDVPPAAPAEPPAPGSAAPPAEPPPGVEPPAPGVPPVPRIAQ